jgi:hypothetical protein
MVRAVGAWVHRLPDSRVNPEINRSDAGGLRAAAGRCERQHIVAFKGRGVVRRRRRIAVAAVVSGLAVGAFGGTAPAQAACQVTPNRPLIRVDGGNRFTVWGWAYISGFGTGTQVRIYICEYLGKWSCGHRLIYYGPLENANYNSASIPIDCDTYGGSGKLATGWSYDGGTTKHVGTGKQSYICQ